MGCRASKESEMPKKSESVAPEDAPVTDSDAQRPNPEPVVQTPAAAEQEQIHNVCEGRRKVSDVWEEYDVIGKIGAGGYGKVLSVREKSSGKKFAMKTMDRFRNGKDYGDRFWAEYDVLKAMSSGNAVMQCFDAFYDDTTYYLVCELLTGGELLGYILHCKRFSERQASKIFKMMMLPLLHLHENRVAHLDLKPENYVFSAPEGDPSRRLVLIDFGCASKVEDHEIKNVRTGTPYYIAPQMLQSKVEKTGVILRACDMWSMGVILFILTTGRLPFFGDQRKNILKSVLSGSYSYPGDVKLSPSVKDLISKLLCMDYSTRLTCQQALQHPWLSDIESVSDEPLHPTVMAGIKDCWDDYSLKRALGALLVKELSDEDKSNLHRMFKKWDSNGDGMLQFVEVVKMVEKFGYDKGEAHSVAKALVDEFDLDKNGEIDLEEFSAIGTRGMLSLNKNFAHQLFDYLDRDGNGTITKDEIELYFAEHPDFSLEMDIMSMIREADLDRDGTISRTEFMIAMGKKDMNK